MGNIKWISSVVFIAMGLCQYLSTENQTVIMEGCLIILGISLFLMFRKVLSILVYFWVGVIMIALIAGIFVNKNLIGVDVGEYIISGSLSLSFLIVGALAWRKNKNIAYLEFFCAFLVIILSVIVKI
ncbi:hypothetical protein [Selenomonas sp. ND2010]|uniref:hypothetical protein n=1 Tax=Selenomonas sp. ND2010 TaxID=1410618 RepID=UPI00051BB5B2|nr:hypothetical protein [Selenomonas sp. ND2010]